DRWRQVLDFIEHCLKPLESRCIRWCGKHALELAPDNRGVKLLCVRVPNAPEHLLSELLFAVLQEMVVTPVVERAEIVFHDLGIIRASVPGHDEDGLISEGSGKKFTDGGLLAPVDDLLGNGCSHEIIVEQ